VTETVPIFIREQPKAFFSDGMRKLVDHYRKGVELQTDYLEK
jgi:uncharacterized protein YqkB